jgi:hypothetical protein
MGWLFGAVEVSEGKAGFSCVRVGFSPALTEAKVTVARTEAANCLKAGFLTVLDE